MTHQSIERDPPSGSLPFSFKRRFWILCSSIVLGQAIGSSLDFQYWAYSGLLSEYYLYQNMIGLGWYILVLTVVAFDLWYHDLTLLQTINPDLRVFRRQIPTVLKYFLGTGLAVFLLSFLSAEEELGLSKQDAETRVLTFAMIVVVAPVFEEIFFRGYLHSAMRERFKRRKERLVINAMLFAAAHVFFVTLILEAPIPYYILIIGYLLADLYEQGGSTVPGMLLHALNNGLVFCIDLMRFT